MPEKESQIKHSAGYAKMRTGSQKIVTGDVMLTKIWTISSSVVLILFLGLTLNTSAFGASSCKGLTKTKCSSKSSCSWVDSYKTKTGTRVKGYCRAKPGKGAGASSGGKAKKVTSKGKGLSNKVTGSSSSASKEMKKKSSKLKKTAKNSAEKSKKKSSQ